MLNGVLHVPPQSCCSAGRVRGPDRTPAAADPECFGDSCRLPQVVEPPVVGAARRREALPVSRAPSEAPALQAFAQSPRRPLPKLAPSSEPPLLAAEPPYRRSERVRGPRLRAAPPCGSPSRSRRADRYRGRCRGAGPPHHRTRVVQGQINPGRAGRLSARRRAGAARRADGDLRRLRRAPGLSGRAERQDHPRRPRRRLINRPGSGCVAM